MNILVMLTKNFAGCGFYRLYQPHNHLAKKYKVNVMLNSGLRKSETEQMTDEEIKKHDIVVWHKGFFELDDVKRVKKLGIPTVVDFDDHWVLNPEHLLSRVYAKDSTSVKLHKLLLLADYVTTTTEALADEIYRHNRNVYVFPNAMDMSYPGCKIERRPDEKYCLGYLGGHFHLGDMALLKGLQKRLTESCKNYELRLFGFDDSFVYKKYADILSDSKQSPNFGIYKGLPIWQYPQFYNLLDCSLVPLENNRFNRFKSELKMIEAGFFKKAVIVSNTEPYTNIINNKNCLKVTNIVDWYNHSKRLIENPELGKELGENLYQSVQKFSIERVNKSRYKLYCDVYKKHYNNSTKRLNRVEIVN